MSFRKKEAALFFGILASLAQLAMLLLSAYPHSKWVWMLPGLTALSGWATRTQVFSRNTLEEAGLDPEVVEEASKEANIGHDMEVGL